MECSGRGWQFFCESLNAGPTIQQNVPTIQHIASKSSLLQVTRMVPKAATKPKSVLYNKCGWLRKKIGPWFWFGVKLVFLRVWQSGSRRHGRVGGLHLAEAWPGAGWPVPYLVRGPCGGNWAQGGRWGELQNLPPPEITSMDHQAASPTAKSKIRSSERNIAPDINNHLKSIDRFRSVII